VVFLHRVEPGTAAGSYGVHVARLAGLPDRVTEVADRILAELLAEAPLSQLGGQVVAEESLPLFGADDHPIIAELRKLDPERITPLEALQILADLQSRLD
jgi:DNA mismatch repair protein MutS